MDDRKYRQRGYQDSGRPDQRPANGSRPHGPKLPLDVTGPRLPRLVQTVTAARCFNCTTTLPQTTDFASVCPKCAAELHCCKQCAHFEPSTRFQCLKPIPERVPYKDRANTCTLFSPRVTVARDATAAPQVTSIGPGPGNHGPRPNTLLGNPPRNAQDARAAFDNLFKK